MSGIVNKMTKMGKKMGYYVMQYGFIGLHWFTKLSKTQLKKMKKTWGGKGLNKAYSSLGAEVYSYYKQGMSSDWKQHPTVEQKLKSLESEESKIFKVDEAVNEIQNDFLAKKEEIEKKYAERRAAIDADVPQEGETENA